MGDRTRIGVAPGIVMRGAHFPGRAPIDTYGNGGFRFADMSHRGSILCLPGGIYGWAPSTPFVASDFDRVIEQASSFEFLLIGMGAETLRPSKAVAEHLRAMDIRFDAMSTGAAVRTFNVMLAEDRAVAAALVAV